MTMVKICGLTRPEDVDSSKDADYVGFVVESDSTRSLPLKAARDLMSVSCQKRVVVTTLSDVHKLIGLVDALEPEVLQAHSLLSRDELRLLGNACRCDLWALVPVGDGSEMRRALDARAAAKAAVLDTAGQRIGGTGRSHDWRRSAEISTGLAPFPIVLAGGLSPENVAEAVATVRPCIVDVSSGVETAGRKDPALIRRFIEAAKEADR